MQTLTFSVDVSPWHMICGGQGMLGPQSSCELFNWQTLEQCQIPDFPYPAEVASGIVFNNDVPCICGGFTGLKNEKRCYRLDKRTKTWTPVC